MWVWNFQFKRKLKQKKTAGRMSPFLFINRMFKCRGSKLQELKADFEDRLHGLNPGYELYLFSFSVPQFPFR